NGTATIAGTPGAGTAGSYPITITASNGTAPDATQNFTLTVSPGAGCVGVPVSLPTSTVEAETTILVPVTVGDLTGLNITSYEFTVSYDTSVLQLASPAFETTGTLTGAAGGYTVFNDTTVPSGQVRIGAFGTTPLSGAGTLIFIRFNVLPGPGMVTSPLKFIDFRFGEGTPADCTTNGSVTRFGPTAAPANIGGRVMTAGGKSISKVRVMISGGDLEEPIYVLTNGFGYYNFENLSVGETYIIEVKAKGYKFANPTLVINLQDNLTGTDFIGEVEIYGAK
ncbi:MAG TPA: cohesin domain-containing protein, partial [Pyrinomonadaceae bacterium]